MSAGDIVSGKGLPAVSGRNGAMISPRIKNSPTIAEHRDRKDIAGVLRNGRLSRRIEQLAKPTVRGAVRSVVGIKGGVVSGC